MARFVNWLRESDFAGGLFAISSLNRLVIGQSTEFDLNRSVIRVSETQGRFLLVFQEDAFHQSERVLNESELIGAFRKLIASLRWFPDERIN